MGSLAAPRRSTRPTARERRRAGAAAAPSPRRRRPGARRVRIAALTSAHSVDGIGHRHDDEIREEEPVRVQVARRDSRVLMSADHRDGAVGRDRRQRRPASVEDDDVGLRVRPRRVRRQRRSTSRRHRRARRRSAGTRPSRPRRGQRSRDGRMPHDARLRESSTSDSTVGATVTTSGSAGPPLPIATTTTRRSAASSRARCPVTAVLPTRFPVPTTAIDGSSNASSSGGSSRKSAPTYGTPRASTRLASENRATGPSTGSSERSTTTSGACCAIADSTSRNERHAVVLAASQLLLSADEDRRDELVRQLRERVTHDGGVVLAVDDRESSQVRVVTSSSIAPVNFAYSSVSSANETSFTWPWNGCRRQMSTRLPSISITL